MKSYKTEINPTEKQKQIINQTIGVCRFIYNFYLAHNKDIYKKENRFISGITFSKWLNNEFLPNNQEYIWIKNVSSKSVKQSIMNGETAFKRFFKKQNKFPKFKKKNKENVKMYFVKTDNKSIIKCERHRIKIPTIGWVNIKEKGYLPVKSIIKSGTISIKAGRYYVSILIDDDIKPNNKGHTSGIGIDLGLKDFAIISNGIIYKNINKTNSKIKFLEKKLKKEQRKLSRKYEGFKKRNKNKKEGETTRQNIQKQIIIVQKIHKTLTDIRTDYINKIVNILVKTKPEYITIEDLNVSRMMKNWYLSKVIAQQKFYEFRTKLQIKCNYNDIELRIADRWYPSSKICHNCGSIKKDLKLSDRIYTCDCGYTEDRDLNASFNLRDTNVYKIA